MKFTLAFALCGLKLVAAYGGQAVVSFNKTANSYQLSGRGTGPTVIVSQNDYWGVSRAAQDLVNDFAKVTHHNGTLLNVTGSGIPTGHGQLIIVGTIGHSPIIDALISAGKIRVPQIQGKWESFQTQLVNNVTGSSQALVIAGSDKRGSIYGIYDVSRQIGVSPWYFWADVPTQRNSDVYALAGTKVSGPPSVKYRGIFLNDEAPALTNWIQSNYPRGQYAPGYNHAFYETVFELLLRLRANYLWPAEWNGMFYVDDPLDGPIADEYGIVMGTSHTEPLARHTKEQSTFLNGTWSWQYNQANVTSFLQQGVDRASKWETLWTMGMRGLGDTSSPTLNSTQLEQILQVEQQLLRNGLNTTNLTNVPQMWCIYKEVGGYYEAGMTVPEDVTILWADDNWGNPERLPIGNETTRLGGNGIYYHFDYVGGPRDYKWINTMSLPYVHEKLIQSYDRSAREIWVFNVGDLKPLEIPINFAMDLAFNIDYYHAPNSTAVWLQDWATQNYGAQFAPQIAEIMQNYSMLAARRKYELVDVSFYSLINYNEFDNVIAQWTNLANAAQKVYNAIGHDAKPSFFEMILHPALAGQNLYQMYYAAAKNILRGEQYGNSANEYLMQVFNYVKNDASLTMQYHSLLDGKWNHMMDQTHFGYNNYWQQPMRNALIGSLSYVQTQLSSISGFMGVTAEGNNGTIPGDDPYHGNGGASLTLPPMDPYMATPTRWIDIFARGTESFDYYVNISVPYLKATPSRGTLQASGSPNNTDVRVQLSVDWSKVPVGNTVVTFTVNTTSTMKYPFNQSYPFGPQYQIPSISVTLNNTKVPSSFKGFVESDRHVSIEPEHFTTNKTSSGDSAYYAVIPGYGRTLSGVTLLPPNAPAQKAGSGPSLQYSFYSFNTLNASVSVHIGPTLNTDPNNPVAYAVSIDNETPQTVQPIPITVLGTYGDQWTRMVSNFTTFNTTIHPNIAEGAHTLNLWALTPSITFQKVIIDFGGVRDSYLGPPESKRV